MAITEYDNLSKEVAEGRGRDTVSQRATVSSGARTELPIFLRYVILETIFDPQIIDTKKLDYWEHELGVTNIKYAVVPPRNAIIARRVLNNNASPIEPAMVLYPFFPPNLSLPCKPGEHVWVMFEDPTGTRKDLGYWFCRIVTSGYAEDVNHTHPHRVNDPSFVPGIKDLFEGKDKPVYEFRNGSAAEIDGERLTAPETRSAVGGDDAYKKLMTESDGGKLVHYEPVPRYRKRPDEVVFEGTNNSLIVLGRHRSGPVATYKIDEERGLVPSIPIDDVDEDGAATIDFVVGRGQTESTRGKAVDNDLPAKEIGKGASELSEFEGDPDYKTDRSRILNAQQIPVDKVFELDVFNREFANGSIQGEANKRIGITDDPASDPNGDSAIVLKTDKLRLIARSDVEILVPSFTRDENGKMIDGEDSDNFCAFVMNVGFAVSVCVILPLLLG